MLLVRRALGFLGVSLTEVPWKHIAKKDKNIAVLLKDGFKFIINARVATRPIILGGKYYSCLRERDDSTSEFAMKKKELQNEFGSENVHVSLAYDVYGNSFESARSLWVRKT